MRNSSFILCFVGLAFSGCAEHQSIVEPGTISLKQAMVDTVDALAATRAEGLAQHTHFRFYGCTVTAVFNISATGTVDNKIALSATGGPPAAVAPVSVNLSGSHEVTESGTRGNTVTVLLATPECLPNGKVEAAKPAAPSKSTKPTTSSKKDVNGKTPYEREDPVVPLIARPQ